MRKFSIFPSPKAQKGEPCTYDKFLEESMSPRVITLCKQIAEAYAQGDKDKVSALKKQLPVVTWQAYFPERRKNEEAQPSGLFMFDIDHVEDPTKVYESIIGRVKELGIVFIGKTASQHGLRLLAKCRDEMFSIPECQQWLAKELNLEFDPSCKDMARCSFLVPYDYTYFMDANAIWQEDPSAMQIYDTDWRKHWKEEEPKKSNKEQQEVPNQQEGLFGGPTDYKGLEYADIAQEWLRSTGGEPVEGDRNNRLYKLALRMRYITDFNEATLMRIMPRYGLPEEEMKQLVHSAVTSTRAQDIPLDLSDVIKRMERRQTLVGEVEDELPAEITDTTQMPPLPPIIRQMVDCAPDDFKKAVILAQLPILGTVGSKLRAKYLDGNIHSPTFMVSLEAPQASGKSFLRKLVDYELAIIKEHDEEQREKEREYEAKIKEMRMLNIKVTVDNKDEILGTKPKSLIRYVPATMSVTKLLMRMCDAQGLHLFAFSEEIDTVLKAFKRSFSSYSDLQRVGFDNAEYGQDYASDNSFSGNINIYYNFLASGTPKAMRRFYPDVEDGLVSRVCFITLPDQFGKPMPVWKEMDEKSKALVDRKLIDLSEVSIIGEEVQPDHMMKMDFLNKEMAKWILAQQDAAVRDNDRTRDIFCRRSAVVGFRAGMLAWFLYGEVNTPTIRRNVVKFAQWVANSMLNQHLLRFEVKQGRSNVNAWEDVFERLNDEFTREDLEKALEVCNNDSDIKQVIYKWKLLGLIQTVEEARRGTKNKKTGYKFKKI